MTQICQKKPKSAAHEKLQRDLKKIDEKENSKKAKALLKMKENKIKKPELDEINQLKMILYRLTDSGEV